MPSRRRRVPRRLVCLALAAVAPVVGAADPVVAAPEGLRITTARLDLGFTSEGAGPVQWRACHPSCAQADAGTGTSVVLATPGDLPPVRVVLSAPGAALDLRDLRSTAVLVEDARARTVVFEADGLAEGVRIARSFTISRDGYLTVMTVSILGPGAAEFMRGRRLEIEVGPGRGLSPGPAAGFAAMLDRVGRVLVGGGAVRAIPDDLREPWTARPGDWAGVRGRFWALVIAPDATSAVAPRPDGGLTVTSEPGRTSWRYTWYSGPIERAALRSADPELDRLRLSGLWWWLRALSLVLGRLLGVLTRLIGNAGVAIIALALAVKILLLPLTLIADRLQEQVNATQARLQPGLEAINAAHRGEERARRTWALYREHGVHPLYTLKSLLGFLIQVPVFIAVFDLLAEDFDLYRVPFLWMADLSRPDELLHLPACLPFFGCYLNLLPFLMSAASLATLVRYRSAVLTPVLARRQRRNLAGMTALFFLLFYTFPAGMVLYWTSTNTVQLGFQELKRRLARPKPVAA